MYVCTCVCVDVGVDFDMLQVVMMLLSTKFSKQLSMIKTTSTAEEYSFGHFSEAIRWEVF